MGVQKPRVSAHVKRKRRVIGYGLLILLALAVLTSPGWVSGVVTVWLRATDIGGIMGKEIIGDTTFHAFIKLSTLDWRGEHLTRDDVEKLLGERKPDEVVPPGDSIPRKWAMTEVAGRGPASGGIWIYTSNVPYWICWVFFDETGTVQHVELANRD